MNLCKKQNLAWILIAFMALLMPELAHAAENATTGGLVAAFNNLSNASKAGTKMIFVASSLIGVGLMIAGGIKLKKYADNPQQNPVGTPLIYILAGVVIFGVSATSKTMTSTIFGTTETKTGIKFEDL
ncbi:MULTISPECIES: hypothetical protein [Pseudomonas]|uniref:hypothetical protein n=1 Tax=Pseudomonas TaxID=286 RepID=UPI000B338B73|nr:MULTISPECIES: hypothetical protein [Pseudomonas]EKV1241261.1 hypothetical protein [Pseudomonas aeruginosa]EKV8586170.1 hypothetical protein [Pseudomonas aeruginosa]ELN5407388.1 hypothetical protein [Pseudomonas aeruginosa]ELP1438579.1 hypothetical protein [Pseudomonas aeruginosa]THB16463.1 hypothetical protein E6W26_29130 [Pseudomonas aeruginosa]